MFSVLHPEFFFWIFPLIALVSLLCVVCFLTFVFIFSLCLLGVNKYFHYYILLSCVMVNLTSSIKYEYGSSPDVTGNKADVEMLFLIITWKHDVRAVPRAELPALICPVLLYQNVLIASG